MDVPHNLVWATASACSAVVLLIAAASLRGRRHGVRTSGPVGVALLVLLAVDVATLSALERPQAQWRGDFSTGRLSQWAAVHAARAEAVTLAGSPSRGYAVSARFEVQPGDRTFGQTDEERAELASTVEDTGSVQGAETWTGWSSYFPVGTRVPEDGWMLVSQWHQEADTCPPNVAFYITDGDVPRLQLTVRGGTIDLGTCEVEHRWAYDLGPLQTGRWVDFKVHALWSANVDEGSIAVQIDGRQVLPRTRSANLFEGQDAYLKQGIYRSSSAATSVVYHSGTAVGATADSIPLRRCQTSSPWRYLTRAAAWC